MDLPEILSRSRVGARLNREEIRALFDSRRLLEIGQAAHASRLAHQPGAEVSFIIDRNINYTNVCVYRCKFCAFYRPLGDEQSYLLSFDEIAEKVEETVDAGGTGILLQGGVHPGLKLEDYAMLLRRLKERFPTVHLHAFSAPEIWYVAKAEKRSIDEVLEVLVEAGLDSIPGGGAEILEEETRIRISSRAKAPTEIWLDIHRKAHQRGLRTTATMMFGVGESIEARIEHLLGIRSLQDETGGFTAFIPWTFQEQATALEGQFETSGGVDYLKTLAISRLALDNFDHVQGSWVTQGPKMGQVSLFFGADDLGSIMLEENVVAAAGASYQMSRDEMVQMIEGAGFQARQRRTLYEAM